MKHSIKELYKINGKGIYSWDYIEANNIPKAKSCSGEDGYREQLYVNSNKGILKVTTTEGIKIVYLYGEKTWFDSEEERDAYRVERAAEREHLIKRNKVLKIINEKIATHLDTLTTEQLEALLATL